MSDSTARYALPFILPGQAQKELYHNEALTRIDAISQASVEEMPMAVPPASPVAGQCWIVDADATGAWSGRENQLAAWTDSGWRFITPQPGMQVWCRQAGFWIYWNGSQWSDGALPAARILVAGQQVVGRRQPAILSPSGGTIIDAEARLALGQVIATLMSHGLIG